MRLFTTMLVALLSILGGCNLKAQVTVSYESTSTPASEITTGYYVIKAKYQNDSERWAYMNGSFTKFTTDAPTSYSGVWYIDLKDENTFYIKNAGTGAYIMLAKSLSPEADDGDNGGNLTSTFNKSDATYFCANAEFQLNASSSKFDTNAFTIYAGAKAASGTVRQHLHANSIGNANDMTMSSWSTTIGSENVGASSSVGQFAFYKATLSDVTASPVASESNLYYLQNKSTGFYVGRTSNGTGCYVASQSEAKQFYLNKQTDGRFKLISDNNQITVSNTIWYMSLDDEDGGKVFFTLTNAGDDYYYISNENSGTKYMSSGSVGKDVTRIDQKNESCKWAFIPANESATTARDLKLNIQSGDDTHGNIATFSASYPVTIPDGCTAYTATHDATNNVINITELEDNVIPANTGVLIKNASTGEVAMKPTLEAGTAVTDNKLMSVGDAEKTFTDDETSANNIYLLGKQNETLCFRLMNNEGTQKIGAHKAYIQLDNATQPASLQINFGGEVTGINQAATTNKGSNTYYDLSGRRVAKPQHGLYIVNGKKVIIK